MDWSWLPAAGQPSKWVTLDALSMLKRLHIG